MSLLLSLSTTVLKTILKLYIKRQEYYTVVRFFLSDV